MPGIEGRRAGEHLHRAVAHAERDDRSLVALEQLVGQLLRLRLQRRLEVVADLRVLAERIDQRAQLVLAARELVVVVLLERDPPEADVVEADRQREQAPGRVAALEALARERAVAGQQLAVRRPDDAALDLLLLDQRALVLRLLAQRGGAEHGPARAEADEHREQHHEEHEETEDRRVHAGWRARLEIASSSATRMKLATIDEPP